MPKYALLRAYPPDMTRAQVDGMAMSGLAGLATYLYRGGQVADTSDHGLRWIRSYWEPGGTWGMCLFEAPSLDPLAAFQDFCGTPYLDAWEVEEILADAQDGDAEAAKLPRVAFTLHLDAADPMPAPDAITAAAANAEATFVRAYWSPERGAATAVVLSDPAALRSALPEETHDSIATIVEFVPEDYL